MDIFKLKLDKKAPVYKLNPNTFINATKKKEPFFQVNGKERKYYAICPECNNPISIVNLFIDRKLDENKRIVKTHGRHIKSDVKGLAAYHQQAYDNCSLANPSTFQCTDMHTDDKKVNEIIKLVKKYPDILYEIIVKITGIKLSYKDFSKMVSEFVSAKGYYYRYVTKWNLPYSFLYMQKQFSIYYKGTFNKNIERSIMESKYFTITKGLITRKSDEGYYQIYFYFTNHKLGNGENPEKIDFIIEEQYEKDCNVVYKETIELDKTLFLNLVSKKEKLLSIVEAVPDKV